MNVKKQITLLVASSIIFSLSACTNNTDQSSGSDTKDTNLVETRRFTDTTTNPITGDTAAQAGDTTGTHR